MKRISMSDTLDLISGGDSKKYLVNLAKSLSVAFNGDIVFDKSIKKKGVFMFPLNMQLFGGFCIDYPGDDLHIKMPATLNMVGDFKVRTLSTLGCIRNNTLQVNTMGDAEIDFMGRNRVGLINRITAQGTITIKNYTGKEVPSLVFKDNHWGAKSIVFKDCPNLALIPSTTSEEVKIQNCPNVYVEGNLLKSNYHFNADERIKLDAHASKQLVADSSIVIERNGLDKLPESLIAQDVSAVDVDLSELKHVVLRKEITDFGISLDPFKVVFNGCHFKNGQLPNVQSFSGYLSRFHARDTNLTNVDQLTDIGDIRSLDLTNSPIRSLPSGLEVDKLFIRGTKVDYLPFIFNEQCSKFRFKLDFDTDQLKNVVEHNYIVPQGQHSMIALQDNGKIYIFCQHETINNNCVFALEDYIEEIHSDSMNSHTCIRHYIPEHTAYLKLQLDFLLRKLNKRLIQNGINPAK